eukprot:5833915-Ditylum_brightwellii.AAC.1
MKGCTSEQQRKTCLHKSAVIRAVLNCNHHECQACEIVQNPVHISVPQLLCMSHADSCISGT